MKNEILAPHAPKVLSVLRFIAGAMMMQHGAQKVFGLLGAPHGTAPIGSFPWVGGVIEFFGGLLVAIGLFTRPAAFLLSGTMAVAYWTAHGTKSFWPVINEGELAALYCFVFLYLFIEGGGAWALDRLLGRSKRSDH